ncbi:MAG: hypothetical protein DRQ64_00280 [Gammaproteobacteria bacterium]|nr:MAG: hypothetical protein DRQ64_00280 [Gammaproteobacteria bacterium]
METVRVLDSRGEVVEESRVLQRHFLGGDYVMIVIQDDDDVCFQLCKKEGDSLVECLLAPLEILHFDAEMIEQAFRKGQNLVRKKMRLNPTHGPKKPREPSRPLKHKPFEKLSALPVESRRSQPRVRKKAVAKQPKGSRKERDRERYLRRVERRSMVRAGQLFDEVTRIFEML